MSTITLAVTLHLYLIAAIGVITLAHLGVLRISDRYKLRRLTRHLLPWYHIMVASNIFTGVIILAMSNAFLFKHALMIIATIALIGLHIAIKKALKWGNPKDDAVFAAFKSRVMKLLLLELAILLATTAVTPYITF